MHQKIPFLFTYSAPRQCWFVVCCPAWKSCFLVQWIVLAFFFSDGLNDLFILFFGTSQTGPLCILISWGVSRGRVCGSGCGCWFYWTVSGDTWHGTCDTEQMTCDTWHMRCYTWLFFFLYFVLLSNFIHLENFLYGCYYPHTLRFSFSCRKVF